MSSGRAFLSAFTPSLMSQEALEAIFVQVRRRELLERLIENIRISSSTTSKHHTLLVGPRGIGKTHLITMLYYRLRNNPENAELDSQLRIAWLKEEERGVPTFGHLARRILQKLAEEYKDDALAKEAMSLQDLPGEFETNATELLTHWLGDRTLLIMTENFHDILHQIDQQGQRSLRAYLQNQNNVLLLAATPSLTSPLTKFEAPFYGFFNVEVLHEMEEEDALELLQKIAEWRNDTDLLQFLETQTARNRIRVIKVLAGGHPRIWILFAGVLTRQTLDETVPLFLEMLDDLTPYYQSRLDSLSPQQAQVMECLIEMGRSVAVWEIAKICVLEPNSVTVQLRLLGEQGYVRADKLGRVAYYELREPLMRLCLEVKSNRGKPLKVLVDFLRHWYNRSELEGRLAQCMPNSYYEKMHLQAALEKSKGYRTKTEAYKELIKVFDLWEVGEYDKTLQRARTLVDKRGDALDLSVLGKMQHDMENQKGTVFSYNKAVDNDLKQSTGWRELGVPLSNLNRFEEATASYNYAIEITPNNPYYWHYRGISLGNLNRFDEALVCIDKGLELEPNDTNLVLSKAEIYMMKGMWDKCLETLSSDFSVKKPILNMTFWVSHGREMWRGLLRIPSESQLWEGHVSALIQLYKANGVLAEVGTGIVEILRELLEPIYSDYTVDAFNVALQNAGKGHDEWKIPLRLLEATVQWRKTHDPAVLFSLRSEERAILLEALSLTREEMLEASGSTPNSKPRNKSK